MTSRQLSFLRSTPVLLLGATAAAVGTAYLLARDESQSKPRRKPDCSKVGAKEGELDGVRYIEHVTKGANPNAVLPMLVVFHSLWATPKGSASFSMLPPTRVIRPFGPFQKGTHYSWFATPSKGNEQKLVESMRATSRVMKPFLQDIVRCRPTLGHPVVTGSSQGGMMAYLMASTAAPFVKGAVSVAGRLPQSLWNQNMAPSVGIHGTRDKTVSYEQDVAFAEAMGFPLYSFDAAHEVTAAMGKKWVEEVKKKMGHTIA